MIPRHLPRSLAPVGLALAVLAPACAGAETLPTLPQLQPSHARPGRSPEPLAEVRVQPAAACAPGAECTVTLAPEPHSPRADTRRAIVVFDWPGARTSLVRSEGIWRCRPFSEAEIICLARVDEIAAGRTGSLTLRLPSGTPDPRLCVRTRPAAALGRLTADPARVRLLQAAMIDNGRDPGPVDGSWGAATAAAAQDLARTLNLPAEDETVLAAALLGATVNRQPLALPPCTPLVGPQPVKPRS
jgi:hypothetical protein